MADLQLSADTRVVTGKKVKSLRRDGILPAHLYGRDTESQSLQAPAQSVLHLLKTAGRNAIIDLQIAGEPEARPVVLRGVQRNPVTGELVHIDFFQISLTEKLRADVQLVIVGDAPAVTVFNGVMLQSLDILHVEALPMDIPPKIEVDVSILEELESAIFVRDLPIPANVEVFSDPDQIVVKVEAPRIAAEIEAEAAAAAEEAAVAAAATPEGIAAAAAAAAGEEATEEKSE